MARPDACDQQLHKSLDEELIGVFMHAGCYNRLPEPLGPKDTDVADSIAYTIQVRFFENDDGTFDIMKWYKFDAPQ